MSSVKSEFINEQNLTIVLIDFINAFYRNQVMNTVEHSFVVGVTGEDVCTIWN